LKPEPMAYIDDVKFAMNVDTRLKGVAGELEVFDSPNFDATPAAVNPQYLPLPWQFPSDFGFQDLRFKMEGKDGKEEEGVLRLLPRRSMSALVKEVKERVKGKIQAGAKGLSVTGFQGAGKSFALYAMVCYFRLKRDQYRVTYIPDCAHWALSRWKYLLRALVATFHDDMIPFGEGNYSISDLCAFLERDALVDLKDADTVYRGGVVQLMEALGKYTRAKKLQWILVIDQENKLYSGPSPVFGDYPFTLSFSAFHTPPYWFVVVSASANNEGFNRRDHFPKYAFGLEEPQYTPAQFDRVMEDAKVPKLYRNQIADVTNRIPYYVSQFLEKGSIEKFEDFFREQFEGTHKVFKENAMRYDGGTMFKNLATKMLLGYPEERSDRFSIIFIDQQLMVMHRKEEVIQGAPPRFFFILEAVIPIALSVIREQWRDLIHTGPAGLLLKSVFDTPLTNKPVRGKIVELYIIEQLRFAIYEFKVCDLKVSAYSGEKLHFPLTTVLEFSGSCAYTGSSFPSKHCSLIIPLSQTYPHVDFFIWKPASQSAGSKDELHAFQVTLSPVNDHFHSQEDFMTQERKTRFLEMKDYSVHFHFVVPQKEAKVRAQEDETNIKAWKECTKNLRNKQSPPPTARMVTLEALGKTNTFSTLREVFFG